MNVLDLVEEIIRQRPVTPKPWGKKRHGCLHGGHARPLTAVELAEFRAHVSACIRAKCSPTAPCWEEGCERCGPA